MIKLFKRLGILSLFFLAYYMIFIRFDKYDFFGVRLKYFDEIKDNFVVDDSGNRITKTTIFPTIKYIAELKDDQSYSIILGDSRASFINPQYMANMDANKTTWLNLAFGSCSLEESVLEFYYTVQKVKLDKVVFELDFKALCPELDLDRLTRLEKLSKWELYKCYIFDYFNNRMAMETMADYTGRTLLKNTNYLAEETALEKKDINRILIEDYSNWADKFAIDRRLIAKLVEVAKFCDKNGIELIFFSPPINGQLYKKVISKYDILNQVNKVKVELSYYAPVYDMQFITKTSYMEDDWNEVVHYTNNICRIVERNLVDKSYEYIRIYNKGRLLQ